MTRTFPPRDEWNTTSDGSLTCEIPDKKRLAWIRFDLVFLGRMIEIKARIRQRQRPDIHVEPYLSLAHPVYGRPLPAMLSSNIDNAAWV